MIDRKSLTIIDCDGHLLESMEELARYADAGVRMAAVEPRVFFRGPFPPLDGLHFLSAETARIIAGGQREYASSHRPGSAEDWVALLERAGMKDAVLFTSEGLTVGLLRLTDYTVSLCRAYNDYVADRYRRVSKRLHPMALIPMLDPKEAAKELRRAVRDLDLQGAMLPSTGLDLDLGHEYYWPVYETAAELGCTLAVHGGSNVGLGLNSFNSLFASHVVHHPVALMNACVSIIYRGVFDKWRDLRVAFMEGGCAWTVLLLDRIARDMELMGGPPRTFDDYLTSGQMLVGCEGEDASLPYLARRVGIEPFAYSSDYPHEVDYKAAVHEIDETLESAELIDEDKEAVLGLNAQRFFRL